MWSATSQIAKKLDSFVIKFSISDNKERLPGGTYVHK